MDKEKGEMMRKYKANRKKVKKNRKMIHRGWKKAGRKRIGL
jgi:hypothetical protein